MNGHCNDEDILKGLCQGGRATVEALKCLDQKCKPKIIKWLKKHGIPAVDAEIIWYETVEAVWENLCLKDKPLTTKFCNYLQSIAHNKWKKYWRKRGFEVKDDEDLKLSQPPFQEQIDNPIPKDIQQACWEKLSPKGKEIITANIQGYSNEEMAIKFGYVDKADPAKPAMGSFKTIKSRHWTAYVGCIRLQITKRNCFAKLPLRCQAILKDRRNELSWESIAKKHGFDNVENAMEKHKRCAEQFDSCIEAGMKKFFELDCFEALDDKPRAQVRDYRRGCSLEDIAERHGFPDTADAEEALRALLLKLDECLAKKLSKFRKKS